MSEWPYDEPPTAQLQAEAEVDRLRADLNETVGAYNAAEAEVDRLRADLANAHGWLNDIEKAAGFGPLDDVAEHQRNRGLTGDHEKRLRAKRIEKIIATVVEETEWRHQVLNEVALSAEGSGPYVTPGHPVKDGTGYDCGCGECLAVRAALSAGGGDPDEGDKR